jgi:hypothetical protein
VSLGVAVFASVVLVLAVYHKGFRKVVLWAGGIVVILALLGAGSYFAYDRYTTRQQQKAHKQAIKDCLARFPKADTLDEVACDENPAAVPAPSGWTVLPDYTYGVPAKQNGGASPSTTKKLPIITATVTCDVVVYDRSEYSGGDPQAIDSLHEGDTIQYVGHVTVGDQDIIQIHGRKGYVNGCVLVKP